MTIPTEVMMRMATLGLNETQARAVADMLTAVETATANEAEKIVEAGRAKARERWHKWDQKRRSNVGKRSQTLANTSRQLAGGDARVEDKTLTSEIEPQKEEKKETREGASVEFDAFWTEFPNKVGKPKAKAAFIAARRIASFDAIMAGLRRYVATKPADRAWLNPATFLNQERWADQPATVIPLARAGPKPDPVRDMLTNLRTEMEAADAISDPQNDGHRTAPRLLSADQRH